MPDPSGEGPEPGEDPRRASLAAQQALVLLNGQAHNLRMELAQLRQKLTNVQQEMTAERSLQLQEANEKLILAALHAESIADAAVGSLGELARTTHRDPLTDTPNRALALDRTEAAIAQAKRHQAQVAVMFIDVDGFKQINDRLGHGVGDATLQLVARRLESVVRASDTVSRYGGDEFLVLMAEISQAADAVRVAEKIVHAFTVPARIGEHQFDVSVSIGIAVYPGHGKSARTLIDRADAAMYQAKAHAAGSSFHVFSGDTSSERHHRPAEMLAPPVPGRDAIRMKQHSQLQHLREANQRLVLGALTAQDLQERSETRHLQQVKFIAMVAHELRNPLNPIRNAAGLLKRVRNDQALLENLQGIIERQVVHLARIIDDLLDGSRAGLGKLRLELGSVNILDVIAVAVDAGRPAMEARHQHFNLDLPPGPMQLEGDQFRLAQVFSNLLDNASKYTPEGGHITLSLTADKDAVVVTVADDGIGIQPDALAHIFDLLVQDERGRLLQNHGLGIGLSVVRDLVEAHGGTVVATSAGADQGSQFIVRLPTSHRAGMASAPVTGQ